jgi:hypothetical protein
MGERSYPRELLELLEDQRLAELVQNWNFTQGKEFEKLVFSRFRSSIHHHSSSPRGGSNCSLFYGALPFASLKP